MKHIKLRLNNIGIRPHNKSFKEYEIICWQKNPYYGKEGDYTYEPEHDMYTKGNWHGSPNLFLLPETCYVLAWIEHKEDNIWDITTVGKRPWELEESDFNDYNEIIKLFYNQILFYNNKKIEKENVNHE